MIRSLVTLLFWVLTVPLTALVMFPYTLLTGNVGPIYRIGMWIAHAGVRIAGVKIRTAGLEKLDPNETYVFMSNHASNLDPPVLLPLIPNRTSVLVKKELFRIPVLGQAMRMASLVPVDRSNRERAVESLRAAEKVLARGIHMSIFVEGTRSPDGRLLPFKKGPFHLAIASGKPIVPVTISGTHELLHKGAAFSRAGVVRIMFHDAIHTASFAGDREALMAAVRERIESGLRQHTAETTV